MSGPPHRATCGTLSGGLPAVLPTVGQVTVGDPGRAAAAVVPRLDRRVPFRPGIVADSVRVDGRRAGCGLEVRAASVRGLSHQYYGTTRQDEFAFLTSADGCWLVVAVADGVSAGDRSHRAAEIVSRSGCRRIAEQLRDASPAELDWRSLLGGLAEEVIIEACQDPDLPNAGAADVAGVMAATALFAILAVDPAGNGQRTAYVMAYGDTSAWLLRSRSPAPWTALHTVKNAAGGVASSATAAVPLIIEPLPAPVVTTVAADEVLVLMTDGVGDPLGGGAGEVGAALATAWRQPPDPLTFAAQVGFARRSFDDDRTVVAAWPVSHAP